jgi:hypothetical protein
MKVRFLAAALALLAAVPAAAQQGADPLANDVLEEREQRPFDALLQARQDLRLTPDQVTRIEAIASRLDETNRPLRAELVRLWQAEREQRRAELMRMTPAERRAELRRVRAMGRPPVPENMRPLVQRIRRNIADAMGEAGNVLTPNQRQQVREMVRAGARGRMGPGARRGPGRPGMGRRPPPAARP